MNLIIWNNITMTKNKKTDGGILGKSIRDGIVIILTESYFNRSGEALKAVADEKIKVMQKLSY